MYRNQLPTIFHNNQGFWSPLPFDAVVETGVNLSLQQPVSRYLDLGAGGGSNAAAILTRTRNPHLSIDVLDIPGNRGQHSEQPYDPQPKLRRIHQDITEFSLEHNSYDLIYAVNALEHLRDEVELTGLLEQINQAIKVGGQFFLQINTSVTGSYGSGNYRPDFPLNLPTAKAKQLLQEAFPDWQVLKFISKEESLMIITPESQKEIKTTVLRFQVRKKAAET